MAKNEIIALPFCRFFPGLEFFVVIMHIFLSPFPYIIDNGQKGCSEFGKKILYLWRNNRVHFPVDNAVLFKIPQLLGQYPVAYSVEELEKLIIPEGPFMPQMPNNNDLVFAADNGHCEFFLAGKFVVPEFPLYFSSDLNGQKNTPVIKIVN